MVANEPRDSATDIADRAHRVVIAAACIAATLAGSAPAFCQDKPRDPVAAEALYLSGRKLVGEDKWAEGCEKFRASMELNPAASTMINIARCDPTTSWLPSTNTSQGFIAPEAAFLREWSIPSA